MKVYLVVVIINIILELSIMVECLEIVIHRCLYNNIYHKLSIKLQNKLKYGEITF